MLGRKINSTLFGVVNNKEGGGHIASCGLCDYSVYEAHNLRLENNTEYCTKCDYSISLGLRYISNGDGRTHTRISDTGSRVENCVGIINETGNICCTKCGQVLNTGSGGIIRPNKKEEIAVLLKKEKNKHFVTQKQR
jgi:hypothetical protein